MDDIEFYGRLVRLGDRLPFELHGQSQQRLWRLQAQQRERRQFAYVGEDEFRINDQFWRSRAAGAPALARAVRAPRRWLALPGRRIRAWRATISAVVERIREVDNVLGAALALGRERNGPGTHLRTRDGQVEMTWTPGALAVSCQPLRRGPLSLWIGPGRAIDHSPGSP